VEAAQIQFLDMPRSDAIEAKVQDRVDGLAKFSGEIQKCHVWVESPHGHHHKGKLFGTRIRLTVPGEEIDVDLQPTEDDVYVSIRQAFDAARRKLEDYERRRQGLVKSHPRASGDASRRRQVPARKDRESA
jgi:ribosome-associated translation inhibitor RaiA